MTGRIKRRLPLAALFCAFALLLVLAVRCASSIAALYPAPSLRYSGGISTDTAAAARRYAAKQEEAPWPTYWAEQNLPLESELFSTNADCVLFDGDASLLNPAGLADGRLPGALETNTAAVTKELAWQLWGSHDVTGLTFKIDGKTYTVSGVLEGDNAFALLAHAGEAPAGGWQAAELAGDTTREGAEKFAAQSGLGTPDSLLAGGVAQLAAVMAWLPAVVLALYALVQLLRLAHLARWVYRILLFTAILAFALALPTLLDKVPGWLLPSRWSDFSHWVTVLDTIKSQVWEWLRLAPTWRDTEARMLLVWQGLLFAASLPLLWPICKKSSLRAETQNATDGLVVLPTGSIQDISDFAQIHSAV